MKHAALLVAATVLQGAAAAASAPWYVGSDQCFSCHEEEFNDWQASGHPWKLRKAARARHSGLPLPPGYRWDDISYVIGGVTKKARYLDLEGYIITSARDGSEAKTQYNLEDGSWSFYHKGQKKPYKCGPCHMTGYSPEGHQDGRPGIVGTWAEDGIGCEECHGPGSDHVRDPLKSNISIDRSAEACGKCHHRGGLETPPPAKGKFIRHHEQINELLNGGHRTLTCVECHDPHKRAILARDNCEECHGEVTDSYADNIHARDGIRCIECHMPKMAKSAIVTGPHAGDVRTHLFTIDSSPGAKAFTTRTTKGRKQKVATGVITLDFACLECHASRDLAWARAHAGRIHGKEPR